MRRNPAREVGIVVQPREAEGVSENSRTVPQFPGIVKRLKLLREAIIANRACSVFKICPQILLHSSLQKLEPNSPPLGLSESL